MKYFFLSEGWQVGRVWAVGGLWNELEYRRPPKIEQLTVSIEEGNERLFLYRVESDVLMLEVKPSSVITPQVEIGQVVLKRLMTAEQVIDRLAQLPQT